MNASIPGATRATSRTVSTATLEKRLRRHLAKQGHTLVKSRPGTKQHDCYGRYSIHDESFELLAEHISLVARARAYGLLADGETVEGDNSHE